MTKYLIAENTHEDGAISRFWMLEIDTEDKYEIVYSIHHRGVQVGRYTSEKLAREFWANITTSEKMAYQSLIRSI